MWRKLLFFVPVAVGALAVWWAISQRQPPATAKPQEDIRTVRVVEAEPVSFVPSVSGFGTVKPAKTWDAVVQAAGEVAYVHPDLKRGAILEAGTEIIRISPEDYELAIARANANIDRIDAELAELDLTEANTRTTLQLEQEALAIAERELSRRQELAKAGTVSPTALDQQTREMLTQRQKVQELENTLSLLPSRRSALNAQKKLNRLELDQAKLNKERTSISLPFDARIAEVNAEIAQFAQVGTTLAVADGMKTSEVEAQIPLSQFAAFVRTAARDNGLVTGLTPAGIRNVIERMGFAATIRLNAGETHVEWPGSFSRISDTIDLKTRTVGLFVTANDTWETAIPGERPPLTKGLFVEVELRSNPIENVLVVPRTALHDGRLYLADDEGRLAVREVKTGISKGDLVVITEGLEPGERIVVSDLLPAIEGMRLRSEIDDRLQQQIVRTAGSNVDEAQGDGK